MQVLNIDINEIKPYEKNPRKNDEAVENVMNSIKEFGFKVPIVIDKNNVIVAGHTRYKASKKLKFKEVPCIIADDLTDEQIKAFRLADNKVSEKAEWDFDLLTQELDDIQTIDMNDFGFLDNMLMEDKKEEGHFWGDDDGQVADEDYNEFVDKFKPKKTTDDCYTPNAIYDVVKDWAVNEYHLEGRKIIRPFYPNGDYQKEEYPKDCVVIDNPPFSILSEICRWYRERDIDYFMFGPALTLFSINSGKENYLPTYSTVTYENGAKVSTGFITNLGEYKVHIPKELCIAIKEANKSEPIDMPKYEYPKNLLCVQSLTKIAKRMLFDVKVKNAVFIRALESMKKDNKAIYGGGISNVK